MAALLALGALTRAPYGIEEAQQAVIRLSWRARGVRVRQCRTLTPQEVEALPVHMRRERVCEGGIAPYRLRVALDEKVLESSVVSAAGAREDRPLYVYREVRVAPGRHRLSIDFLREETAETDPEAVPASTPARLTLDADLSLGAGQVALVTFDPKRRALVLRGAPSTSGSLRPERRKQP
ncbi:MAG TPA: hypothetical protein VF212_04230 [Longimicrobiales bacterium]